MGKKQKALTVGLSITVFVAFVLSVIIYSAIEISAEKKRKHLEAVAAPYEAELSLVHTEIQMIERQYTKGLPAGAYLNFAMVNLQPEIATSLFPVFDKLAEEDATSPVISGTLCLSPTDLPGLAGKMPREDFDMLISEGWSTAVMVKPGDTADLVAYLAEMRALLSERGIPVPETLYFDQGSYKTELDGIILAEGFTTAIHYGGDPAESPFLIGRDTDADVWRIGATGWSGIPGSSSIYESSTAALDELCGGKGALVFSMEISYDNPLSRNDPKQYFPGNSEDAVSRMSETLRGHIDGGRLLVVPPADTRGLYEDYLYQYEITWPAIIAKRGELLAEVSRLEGIIDKIYKGESFAE